MVTNGEGLITNGGMKKGKGCLFSGVLARLIKCHAAPIMGVVVIDPISS